MKPDYFFQDIESILDLENVSSHNRCKILETIHSLRSEIKEARQRLDWLEDAIDSSDLEQIYLPYQKRFNLNHWTG